MSFEDNYQEIFALVSKDIDQIKIAMRSAVNNCPWINDDLIDMFNAPSKFIRSTVTLLYLKSLELDINKNIIELLCAVELIHNASLIHDDIIDNSDIRRGISTLNKKFSSKVAVLAGDYILSVAMQKLVKLEPREISLMFSETLENMTKGELNQFFTRFKMPNLESYIEKSRNKTAKLFEVSLNSAILNSGIECENASEFAKNFGIAFQIRDDLMNILNESDGKPTKNDFKEGIYTAAVIFSKGKDIDRSAIEKTYLLLNNYIDQALLALKNLNENKYKRALIELSKMLGNE